MKFIEDILLSFLELLGVEVVKASIGDLFPMLVVAFFCWMIMSAIVLIPVRAFVADDGPVSKKLEIVESVLVSLCFLVSFGGGFYLWATGF